jgi:hypothetical protein
VNTLDGRLGIREGDAEGMEKGNRGTGEEFLVHARCSACEWIRRRGGLGPSG